jgi:O-antigen/teichoic acid export membrane protein
MFTERIRNFFQGNKRSVEVKKNIAYSLLIKGVSIFLSLMIVPLTLGYVSSELYGVWLTLSSLLTWLSFFDIGFTQGLKNKLGEALAKGNYKRGKQLISTTYFVLLVIFIPLCIIFEFLVPFIHWDTLLNVNPRHLEDLNKAMSVIVACFCLQMILNVLSAVVQAFQKVALSSLFGVIGQAISFIVVYLLSVFFPPSLFSLSIAFSCMGILVYFICTVTLFNTKFKMVSPSVGEISLDCVSDIFNLGVKFFLLQIQYIVYYQTTNFLISNLIGPTEVTVYNVAYKYIHIASMIFTIIVTPIWPACTEAYVKNDFTWMLHTYKKMVRIYWMVNFALLAMLMISPFIYQIWVGDKVNVPFMLTAVITLYISISNWNRMVVYIINGTGLVLLQTIVTTIGMFIFIPLAVFWGKAFGTHGIILSLIMINIILAIIYTAQVSKILSGHVNGIWAK